MVTPVDRVEEADKERETAADKEDGVDREMVTPVDKDEEVAKEAKRQTKIRADKEEKAEKESEEDMETSVEKEAIAGKEAKKQMECGTTKDIHVNEDCTLKIISRKRQAPRQTQQPAAKRCTRRNTKLPSWSKSINPENQLGQ